MRLSTPRSVFEAAGAATRSRNSATRLSHPTPHSCAIQPGKTWLARLSLVCLLSTGVSGCIVADPPEYEDPGRTPPFLNLALATPRILDVQVINHSDTISTNDDFEVNVPVRSDDQGEELWAFLHLDYSYLNSPVRPGRKNISASTLSDVSRRIDVLLDLPSTVSGCHQATLIVAHAKSFDFVTETPKPTAKDDVAIATWWLNIITDPNADPYDLTDCPNRNEIQR